MKNAESQLSRMGKRIPPYGWSIAARLTLHYTLSAVLILIVISGVLYTDVSKRLNRRNENHILDEISVLQAMLREPDSENKMREEIYRQHFSRKRVKHYVRILDGEGRVLLQDPGMDKLIPTSVFPREAEKMGRLKWRAANGRSYILKSVQAEPAAFNGRAKVLQVAMDVSSLETFLDQFGEKVAVVLIVGAGVSALAGVIVARRGLLPLSRMTKTVQNITAHRLNERVAPERWPKDLTAFALSFDSMLDRLEESFNGLSQYTGNLAHELRTPINNLMVETDLALSHTRTPEEYQKVLESNMEEYARLAHIIDSLLFLARADHAQSGFSRVRFGVAGELQEVVEFYSALAEDERVTLTTSGNATMVGDPVLFRRAVGNLVSNALNYTPPGGQVIIVARQPDHDTVQVEVADNGCGIPAEDLPRIFDRFFRVPGLRQMDPHGSGLGLSIVKAIMDLHGGRVDVSSDPGCGTSVVLTFPLDARPAPC